MAKSLSHLLMLTDRLDMTIAVDWDVKHQNNQSNKQDSLNEIFLKIFFVITLKNALRLLKNPCLLTAGT